LIGLYVWFGRTAGLSVLLGMFVFVFVADTIRLRSSSFNKFIFRYFGRFIRDNEKDRFTGTPWYVLGVLSSAAIYDIPIALYAVAFLAVGDVSATTIGERWGSIKVSGVKSLQGTIAFFAASVISGAVIARFIYPMPTVAYIAGAAVAAVVEILPVKLNDNLTVPVISGGVMWLLMGILPA